MDLAPGGQPDFLEEGVPDTLPSLAAEALILGHLTKSRHVCYKPRFVLETCLAWTPLTKEGKFPKATATQPEPCAAANTNFLQCNRKLRSKLKQQCRKSYAGLVRCLQNNSNDFSKCQTEFLPFDQCTEDFSPGVDGL